MSHILFYLFIYSSILFKLSRNKTAYISCLRAGFTHTLYSPVDEFLKPMVDLDKFERELRHRICYLYEGE